MLRPERISKRALRWAAPMLAAAWITAAPAQAGQYHVYSCRMPNGASAPVDGWTGTAQGPYTYAEDTCSQPAGELLAALGDQPARTANTDTATWSFAAPPDATIAAATLWRAGDADGGAAVNATYEYWLAGPKPTEIFDECLFVLGCPREGEVGQALDSSNLITVPPANVGTSLYLSASCGGVAAYNCPVGKGDANNYAAAVYLYAADLTLEQNVGPTASDVTGELANAAVVSGTSDIVFSASDAGAGVYQAVFTVDGNVVQRTVVDENGGRCVNAGQTTDGTPAFLYLKPCLGSVSVDVPFDTTGLANGTHHLQVSVTDAAGNAAPVIDRQITVSNGTPVIAAGAPGSPAGSATDTRPNGTGATAQANLAVSWIGTHSARLSVRFGRKESVTGRLTGPGGQPISGAEIEVQAGPSAAGAASIALASPRTAANGSFTMRVPAGASSRTLRFSYRVDLGDPLPVATRTLTLSVGAGLILSVTPHVSGVGRTIRFGGHLLGGSVPASGKLVVLEARAVGGPWIEFDVVQSDPRGRFAATYRFKFAGPADYQFRVISEPQSDYPFEAGASNVVRVHEL
jgi:hypothetical protein